MIFFNYGIENEVKTRNMYVVNTFFYVNLCPHP